MDKLGELFWISYLGISTRGMLFVKLEHSFINLIKMIVFWMLECYNV
jgi:hypothetical protein